MINQNVIFTGVKLRLDLIYGIFWYLSMSSVIPGDFCKENMYNFYKKSLKKHTSLAGNFAQTIRKFKALFKYFRNFFWDR